MKRSFYEMLEVPRDATQAQIDSAFARLTEKLGATTNLRGAAESLAELNLLREGYKILSDQDKRAIYTAKLHATEAGIKLIFFPKDATARKKLGIETVIFLVLASVFTYFVYQQLVRGFNSVQLENAKANKPNIQAPGKATAPAEPLASPSDVKVIGKDSDKQPIPQK